MVISREIPENHDELISLPEGDTDDEDAQECSQATSRKHYISEVMVGDFMEKYEDWQRSVGNYVASTVFQYQQFVRNDDDIGWGSEMQQVICLYLNIPLPHQEVFWRTRGPPEVRSALRKKRQAVTTAMKKEFACKYNCQYRVKHISFLTNLPITLYLIKLWSRP